MPDTAHKIIVYLTVPNLVLAFNKGGVSPNMYANTKDYKTCLTISETNPLLKFCLYNIHRYIMGGILDK